MDQLFVNEIELAISPLLLLIILPSLVNQTYENFNRFSDL